MGLTVQYDVKGFDCPVNGVQCISVMVEQPMAPANFYPAADFTAKIGNDFIPADNWPQFVQVSFFCDFEHSLVLSKNLFSPACRLYAESIFSKFCASAKFFIIGSESWIRESAVVSEGNVGRKISRKYLQCKSTLSRINCLRIWYIISDGFTSHNR